jgi:hypothetical protein
LINHMDSHISYISFEIQLEEGYFRCLGTMAQHCQGWHIFDLIEYHFRPNATAEL